MDNSNFCNNTSLVGAAIYAEGGCKLRYQDSLQITNNSASRYAVIYMTGSEFRGHSLGSAVLFANNFGSLVVFNSNITFMGYVQFENNQPPPSTLDNFRGGAITLFQSNTFINGECTFELNHANNGGAIHCIESKLCVNGIVNIAHNTAARNGGGVFLSNSELKCQ